MSAHYSDDGIELAYFQSALTVPQARAVIEEIAQAVNDYERRMEKRFKAEIIEVSGYQNITLTPDYAFLKLGINGVPNAVSKLDEDEAAKLRDALNRYIESVSD